MRVCVVAAALVALGAVGSAYADPPLGANKNALELEFDCGQDGSFSAVTIGHNLAVAAQIESGGVLVLVAVLVNGQPVYEVPGWADRETWTCTVDAFPAGVTFRIFVTGRG